MKLKAVENTVIVKPIFQEKSKGGLHLPKGAEKFKQYDGFVYGEVVAISDEIKDISLGELVVWIRHEGKRVYLDRKEYRIIKRKWLSAVIPQDYIENIIGIQTKEAEPN